MKVSFVQLFAVIIFACSLSACGSKLPDALAPGYRVPFTRITYMDGSYDTFQQYRGQKVAVLFWAKWCSKSRRALTAFDELAKDSGSQAVFLAVSLDKFEDEAELRRYIDSQNLTGPTHVFSGNGADDETALAFRAFELPILFVVDANGVVQASSHEVSEINEHL